MDRVSLSEEEKDRFAKALLQHLDALYGFAWWLTHRREEIEDLVQETCLRALRSAHQFEPGTNLKAWLFSILKHEWFRRAGLAQREVLADSFSDNPEVPGQEWAVEVDVIRTALQKDLDEALRALPEEYRSAVLLFDLYGFSLKETAEILAIPDGTVKSRLARGRQMLRGRLWAYSKVSDNDQM
ncbi:MAG: RNA polymerase sigma factor [Candidatus Methylomirabilis oxyfera]|nr:RNA polymerase sigma factor [Candidatus Methylomirabilis oxyfera]